MDKTIILMLVLSTGCGSLTLKQFAYQEDNPYAEDIEIAVAELNAHFGCSIIQLKVKQHTACNDLDLENEICLASNEKVIEIADKIETGLLNEPLLVNEDFLIVKGLKRFYALKRLGITRVRVCVGCNEFQNKNNSFSIRR